MELVDVDCECTTVVCGFVIVKGNDMFEDVEFLLLFINIKDFSTLSVSLGEDFIFVDVDDGVDEDNGRFAVTPTADERVSFDVADDDECKNNVEIKEKRSSEQKEIFFELFMQ